MKLLPILPSCFRPSRAPYAIPTDPLAPKSSIWGEANSCSVLPVLPREAFEDALERLSFQTNSVLSQ